jgi:predicted transcriptional regulator
MFQKVEVVDSFISKLMKYRSRTDIIEALLQSAMNGATKTRLMYSAYISYAQVQEYLKFLKEKELLSFTEETQEYKLTEKGLHFLRSYQEISEVVAVPGSKPENSAYAYAR